MAEPEVGDLSPYGEQQAQVADAFVGLSNAVLALGIALAGAPAMREALGREVEVSPLLASLMDDEDPAGLGVNEDDRRPPEDGEWRCPSGDGVLICAAMHDHYPGPGRRRHGEG